MTLLRKAFQQKLGPFQSTGFQLTETPPEIIFSHLVNEDTRRQEGLFTNFNDQESIRVLGERLVGNSRSTWGDIEGISLVPPLVIANRRLSLSVDDSLVTNDGMLSAIDATAVSLARFNPDGTGSQPDDVAVRDWLNCGEPVLYAPPGLYRIDNGDEYGLIPSTVKYLFGPGTFKSNVSGDYANAALYCVGSIAYDNLVIDGLNFTGSDNHKHIGLYLLGDLANITIRNCTFDGQYLFGIGAASGDLTNVHIVRNKFINFHQSALMIDSHVGTDCSIEGNIIDGNWVHTFHLISLNRGNWKILNNRFYRGADGNGFGICALNAHPGLMISGNFFSDIRWDKIEVCNGNGVHITNNFMVQPSGGSTDLGIGVGGDSSNCNSEFGDTSEISDVLISGNTIIDTGAPGILLGYHYQDYTQSHDLISCGNMIINPNRRGDTGWNAASAVDIGGRNNWSINDICQCVDDNMEYGVWVTGDYNSVVEPLVRGSVYGDIMLEGTNCRKKTLTWDTE